jgi:hypothetical protein
MQRTQTRSDRLRSSLEGLPGYVQAKPSVVKDVIAMVGVQGTYVIETIKTDEGFYGFLDVMSDDITGQMVLPPRLMARIYSQRDAITKRSRKASAKAAAETRRANRNGEAPVVGEDGDRQPKDDIREELQ